MGFYVLLNCNINYIKVIIMTKKEFDLNNELEAYPCPDWFKRAFIRVCDTSKIKSKSDLDKAFKKFGEMK